MMALTIAAVESGAAIPLKRERMPPDDDEEEDVPLFDEADDVCRRTFIVSNGCLCGDEGHWRQWIR
jgi:hypothetical protein